MVKPESGGIFYGIAQISLSIYGPKTSVGLFAQKEVNRMKKVM